MLTDMHGFLTGGARSGAHVPAMVALIVGLSAALPLYLWQMDLSVSIAGFLIAGYTARLWAATSIELAQHPARGPHRKAPINGEWRRLGRMLLDPGFWWTLIFGCTVVTASLWYAGLQKPSLLATIGLCWSILATALSYEVTLFLPTTRCRRCRYQLASHLDLTDPFQLVTCPECGTQWTKDDMCLSSRVENGKAEMNDAA